MLQAQIARTRPYNNTSGPSSTVTNGSTPFVPFMSSTSSSSSSSTIPIQSSSMANNNTSTIAATSLSSSSSSSISASKSTAVSSSSSSSSSSNFNSAAKFAIIGYMICSSLMLIVNKLAIHHLGTPSLVLFSQLFSSALCCYILGTLHIIEVDHLEFYKIKSYIIVAIVFLGTVFFNMKTLQYCNVETFIVFRATTPIAVSFGDYLCLGREWPSLKSWMTLLGLIVGAYVYMYTDKGYDVHGYTFVLLWYFVFCLDQLYIKYICDAIPMKTNWGRVYYCNLLASIPILIIGVITNEFAIIKSTTSYIGYCFLILSCSLGLGMSYFAFLARYLTSATTFTVLGNVCKILTVLINFLIWDKHSSLIGTCSLLFCLFCAYHYEQAPLRKKFADKKTKTNFQMTPKDKSLIEDKDSSHKV